MPFHDNLKQEKMSNVTLINADRLSKCHFRSLLIKFELIQIELNKNECLLNLRKNVFTSIQQQNQFHSKFFFLVINWMNFG